MCFIIYLDPALLEEMTKIKEEERLFMEQYRIWKQQYDDWREQNQSMSLFLETCQFSQV